MTKSTTKQKETTMSNQIVYSSKATATRAAKTKRIKNPEFVTLPDGRVAVRPKGSALHDASYRIRSETDSPVKKVWDLCFKHPKAKRRDIVTMAIEAGIAVNTAKTQYQAWRHAEGLVGRHA